MNPDSKLADRETTGQQAQPQAGGSNNILIECSEFRC